MRRCHKVRGKGDGEGGERTERYVHALYHPDCDLPLDLALDVVTDITAKVLPEVAARQIALHAVGPQAAASRSRAFGGAMIRFREEASRPQSRP